jgi:hypothetical protein
MFPTIFFLYSLTIKNHGHQTLVRTFFLANGFRDEFSLYILEKRKLMITKYFFEINRLLVETGAFS